MKTNLMIALRGIEDGDETSKGIRELCGNINKIYYSYTKLGVLQTCRDHADINIVLIGESLESTNPYTAAELNEIDEIREELRIVPIMVDEHHGTSYLRELMNDAIYCGILEKDASLEYVAGIITKGRTKKEARVYYGIRDESGNSISNNISNPDSIASSVSYILCGGEMDDESILSRAVYVKTRLNNAELCKVIGQMPEDVMNILKGCDDFAEFFPVVISEQEEVVVKEVIKEVVKTVPVIKKQEIKIPVPAFVSEPKKKHVYVETERLHIGVISLKSQSGSTFVAINLARYFAQNRGIALVQFPETKDTLYKCLKLNEREDYINHFKSLCDSNVLPSADNIYEDVRLFLHDETDLEWSYVKSIKLLNRIDSSYIIDFGTYYENEFAYLLGECNIIICVLDEGQEINREYIQAVKERIEESGAQMILVRNRFLDKNILYKKEDKHRESESFYESVKIPQFTLGDIKNDVVLSENKQCLGKFNELAVKCGFCENAAKKKRNVSKQEVPTLKVVKEMVLNGTLEIGFLGLRRGLGTTHTALMCAYSLSKQYKVAYVEMNSHKHIGAMGYLTKTTERMSEQFCYAGVDFYQNINYTDFASRHRGDYNFVIYDYGEYQDGDRMKQFFSMEKKFIITPYSIWNRKEVEDFFHMVNEKYDPGYRVIYLYPHLDSDKELDKLASVCEGNLVDYIRTVNDVFHPDEFSIQQFRSHIGVPDEEKKEKRWKRKGGLFSWRK